MTNDYSEEAIFYMTERPTMSLLDEEYQCYRGVADLMEIARAYDVGKASAIKWNYTKECLPEHCGNFLAAVCRHQVNGEFSKDIKPEVLTLRFLWVGNTGSSTTRKWIIPYNYSENDIYAWAELPETPEVK